MDMFASYRIVLADDYVPFRKELIKRLNEMAGLEIIGEAGDGLELLHLLDSSEPLPHMAIIDISMPNMGGIETTRRIKRTHPGMKVLILTQHKSADLFHHALSAGAEGYLLKGDVSTDLFSAIHTIQQNGIYTPAFCSKDDR